MNVSTQYVVFSWLENKCNVFYSTYTYIIHVIICALLTLAKKYAPCVKRSWFDNQASFIIILIHCIIMLMFTIAKVAKNCQKNKKAIFP